VNPTAGTPLGTGGISPYTSAGENGSFIANGKLYWPVEGKSAVGGMYPIGVQCLDLTTLVSCGYTQLDTTTVAPSGGLTGMVSSDGIPAANGNYYFFGASGNMSCFNPTSGPCGVTNISAGQTAFAGGYLGSILTSGQYIYVTYVNAAATVLYMSCYNTATSSVCPGFPINEGTPVNSGFPDFIAPVLSTTGSLLGACDVGKARCYSPTGTLIANPYPGYNGFGLGAAGFGSGAIVGSKFYAGDQNTSAIDCFDFSLWSGSGAVPRCSGFAGPVDASNYTVRALANLPGCLAANGDAAQIVIFNAKTGGSCVTATTQVTVNPSLYYCDGQPSNAQTWGTVRLNGLTGSEYGAALVTLIGVNGPVPGYTNLQLAPGQTTLDLTSLPVSGNTASLTAQVTLTGVSNSGAAQAATVTLSWVGAPIETCFQTKVPNECVMTATPMSNVANAVTAGSNGVSDSPGGASSGTATFNNTPTSAACSLSVKKVPSEQTASPGDKVTYTITVTNTGTAAWTASSPAAFTDSLANVLTDAVYNNDATASAGTASYSSPTLSWSGPLAPGASATITYSVSVNSPATGPHHMVNTVIPVCPSYASCPPSQTVDVPVRDLKAVKTADTTGAVPGQVVRYTITITNTGQAAFSATSPASYTDSLANVLTDASYNNDATATAGTPSYSAPTLTWTGPLPIGGTVTLTYSVKVNSPDTGPHRLANTVVPFCCQSPPPPVVVPVADLSIVKSATPPKVSKVGDVISYNFLVTNTGNVTLTNVSVADTQVAPAGALTSGPTCPQSTLAAGQSETCTGTYTVTLADLDNGSVNDSATATGTPPTGPPVTTPPSTASVPASQTPSIAVVKSATPASVSKVGDVITYNFLVTNTGNVTLTKVSVTDSQTAPAGPLTSGPTCPKATLASGASEICTGTYTVTQADLNNGKVDDTATATGQPPTGSPVVSPPSPATVPATQTPNLSIVKSVTPAKVSKVGDVISYNFLVTNTGNVTLTNVSVADAQSSPASALTSGPTCPQSTLVPGQSETCTGTYTVTQKDLDNGSVNDSATATGTPPTGPPVTPPPSTASVPATQTASIALVKSATPGSVSKVGDVISYNFLVTNTGNVTLTNVSVADTQTAPADALTSGPTCPAPTLAVGASETCTATYTVTQADLNNGKVNDTAAATATPPTGPPVLSPPAVATVPATQNPNLSIVKSSPQTKASNAGDVIAYGFVITNTGNVTLTNVSVTDIQTAPAGALTSGPTCPQSILTPGQSETCTGTYTVTQADVDHGKVDDSATATGADPTGKQVTTPPAPLTVPIPPNPSITVLKSASPASVSKVGDVITYSFVVTNTGNVTLTKVTVTDSQVAPAGALTSGPTCPQSTLAPGLTETCTATYTATQADANSGKVNDTATATGTPPSGPPVTSPPSPAVVPIPPNPNLSIVKSATPAKVSKVGDVISYSFVVTNTGNVTLTKVTVTDSQVAPAGALTSGPTCPQSTLNSGQSETCTGTYTVTQADLDNGSVNDTATATGTPPSGPPVTSPPSPATVPATQTPAITIVKSATPAKVSKVGEVISYSFLVTNTGNVSLTKVSVTDSQVAPAGALTSGPTCPSLTLAVGASETCTGTYTVTQADFDNGSVNDSALASGIPPGGTTPVTSPPSKASVPAAQDPALTVVKTASPATVSHAGDLVSLTFGVTNTGNVTLSHVTVTDTQTAPAGPLSSGPSCPQSTLVPGASETCTGAYLVTQADVNNGKINDTAVASGLPPGSTTPVSSPPATATVGVLTSAPPAAVSPINNSTVPVTG
jgi:uncharacterized repeat protein (TIGR01451 family)